MTFFTQIFFFPQNFPHPKKILLIYSRTVEDITCCFFSSSFLQVLFDLKVRVQFLQSQPPNPVKIGENCNIKNGDNLYMDVYIYAYTRN